MEKKEKKQSKISKEVLNVIRTTQRNNIELTNIADNKANMLLSLNGIMISIAVPLILSNSNEMLGTYFYIPAIIMGITSFATMYISAMVLRPSNFEHFRDSLKDQSTASPFFFGNYFKMEPEEFFRDIEHKLKDTSNLQDYVAQDLFFVGKRLGYKMTWVRASFSLFIAGIFLTLLTTGVLLLMDLK